MWRKPRKFPKTAVSLCIVLSGVMSSAFAQEEERSVNDTVFRIADTSYTIFTDIELTPEGVTAYDSSGRQWIYDFEGDRFVLGRGSRGAESGSREGDQGEEIVEPVEVRCTEEKMVDYPALRAVYIGFDEFVEGDIVANSRVTVKGWVKGSIHSINRTILVTSTGRVDGDLRAPKIVVKPGGIVNGEMIETRPYEIPIDLIDEGLSTAGIWVVFAFTLALSLIVFLTSSLAPRQMSNMTACISKHPVRSFMFGLLFVFLMPIILALISVTVVGLLVVWLVPVAYLVALGLGMGVIGLQLTGPMLRRFAGLELGRVASSLAGVLMFMAAWALVALLLGAGPTGPSGYRAWGVLLLVFSILGTIYPFMQGTGAVFLTRFGFRPYVARNDRDESPEETAPTPAPPPIPERPPGIAGPPPPPPTGQLPSNKPGGSLPGQVGK